MQLWFVSVLLGGLGVVFAAIGGSFLCVLLRSHLREKWLMENGQIIFTDYDSIQLDRYCFEIPAEVKFHQQG